MKILVTGGYGFIGSNLINLLLNNPDYIVLNIDKLSHGSNLKNLEKHQENNHHLFKELDLCNSKELLNEFHSFAPDAVIHLAAQSHVDRSIMDPTDFIQSNIIGTFNLLEASRDYLKIEDKKEFRFLHVSTDEVFGDLSSNGKPFKEDNNYLPSSPYSASKASSDHLVRAWNRTYGLPILISNCSNNYGPFQHFEKMIPQIISCCLSAKKIPIYGDGSQIRDWLFVEDHVQALHSIVIKGSIGESYNIGGNNEISNIELVRKICSVLDEKITQKPHNISSFNELISFVKDRPGHDQRYAIDSSKIMSELNWRPNHSFDEGILKTINWYLANKSYL
tara:strand:- start:19164 stop:20168 length:1005 start_codon:yes stop_codon:yes gene_type:complete